MLYSLLPAVRYLMLVLCVGAVGLAGDIQQVCNCRRGGQSNYSTNLVATPEYFGADPSQTGPPDLMPGLVNGGMPMLSNPVPPPGTLGRTYQLPARLVPAQASPCRHARCQDQCQRRSVCQRYVRVP